VVVYVQPQLAVPVRVFLTGPGPGNPSSARLFPELVEADSSLANIQALLQQRQLTCTAFPPVVGRAGEAAGRSSSSSPAGAGQQAAAAAAAAAGGSSNVVVKRQDGTCCSRVRVHEACSLQQLLEAIWQAEVGGKVTSKHQY
jgi:hypothetical protein